LPGTPSDPGQSGADNRLFFEAILWLARAGAPWRDLPEEFGKWNSVYQRFARWQKRGVQAIGRSRGGLTTKIHALVDALGNPARWSLTAGQTHDVTQAEPLLEGVVAEKVVADKAYDSRALIDAIHERKAEAVIPPRSNSQQPPQSYATGDRPPPVE
jgi:transposase